MKNCSVMKKNTKTAMGWFPAMAELNAEIKKSVSGGIFEEAEEYEHFLRRKYGLEDPAELIKFISPEEVLYWEALLRHKSGKPFCPPPVI